MSESAVLAGPSGRTRVSVIIPVLDDAARLRHCLDALHRQSFIDPFEILVVDNGSRDKPGVVVHDYPAVRLLHEPRPGSYAARNRGVSDARGEILAFTDSDCLPATDWLERGVARIEQSVANVFVGGSVELFPQDPGRPTAAELYEALHAFPQHTYVAALSFSVTANLLVRREVFEMVGEFDSTLASSGDREWGQRAHSAGVRPVFAEEVRVRHPSRRTLAALNRKASRRAIGDEQFRRVTGQLPRGPEFSRFVRPPFRSIVHNVRRVVPPTARSKVLYAGAAAVIHYINAFHQAQTAFRSSRPVVGAWGGRSSGTRPRG